MPPRKPKRPRRPPPRVRVKVPRPKRKRPTVKALKEPAPRPKNRSRPMAPALAAPAIQPREKGRPASNTTCDIYFSPNAPPAAPDVAGKPCTLVARFQPGAEASEGDSTFRWTHLLYLEADVDVRDSYPSTPANRVYVPDRDGTGFDVVFVEVVNRGTPARYKRVFLDRRTPTWPTNEL